MIQYTVGTRGVTFTVRVVPRASSSEIVGEHNGAIKIRIAAPPVEGAANRELVRFLAKSFSVRQSAIEIVSGSNARLKLVRLNDPDAQVLERLRSLE